MFTAREVATVLGLSASRLRSYLRSGFVHPARGDRGELRFSFQDLLLLRKAEGLVTARMPARRVRDALRKLRDSLPDGTPLTGVGVATEGNELVVDDGERRWHPESGQVVFAFQRPTRTNGASVTPLATMRALALAAAAPPEPDRELTARELYERACAAEDRSADEARALYHSALTKDPKCTEAHVNLGRMLHEGGNIEGAIVHYQAALAARPEDPTAAFNLGVALEDLGVFDEALDAYNRAIASDRNNADAHYNVARLLEHLGKPEVAIRHLLIYRQLVRPT